jgi:hypothetical protein
VPSAVVQRATFVGVAGLLLAAGAPVSVFAQCAMCKATLESSDLGAQFNNAILVMIAGPYLVMGAFGLVLFRERLRQATRRALSRLRRPPGPGRSR